MTSIKSPRCKSASSSLRAYSMGSSGKRSVPAALTTTTIGTAEVLEAQARLWCHTYGYLKSMALHSAIKLGVPNAMSRRGGAASLAELHSDLPIAPSKRPCLSRLMRFLVATGIFSEAEEDTATSAATGDQRRYRLTAASRLLVHDDGGDTCLSPFLTVCVPPSYFAASLRLPEWLETEDQATTPFVMAHGVDLWSTLGSDAEFGTAFNAGMGADSRFVARIVVRECGEVFAGVESLVDVGGGDGTMARAIAAAFPNIRCSVLELPHVVDGTISATAAGGGGSGSRVEFVAGDMMEFIPPADALLLKFILHDWGDEDCVRILKRCKDAISAREPKGKLVIRHGRRLDVEPNLTGSPAPDRPFDDDAPDGQGARGGAVEQAVHGRRVHSIQDQSRLGMPFTHRGLPVDHICV